MHFKASPARLPLTGLPAMPFRIEQVRSDKSVGPWQPLPRDTANSLPAVKRRPIPGFLGVAVLVDNLGRLEKTSN